jgi:glycosyltransferase involved in cell wall biosynthesis
MTSFSVVIAAYNQRDRLRQAVESVRRQARKPHELIVVDDGGSDGSAEMLEEEYPDAIVIRQQNLGKGVARNRGAFAATGDWVCFLDHDDLWHPEKLSALDGYVDERPDAIAIDHPVWIFREDVHGPRTSWGLAVDFTAATLDEAVDAMKRLRSPRNDFAYLQRTGRSYEASLRRVFSTTSALSVRRDVFFSAGGFHPAHANGEDWALSANVARFGEWHTLPHALSCQRVLPTGDTTDPAGMAMILATLVNNWYGGRPLRERTHGFSFIHELDRYREPYARLCQSAIWAAIKRKDVRAVETAFVISMLLVPAWRGRLHAVLPPRLTSRLRARRATVFSE